MAEETSIRLPERFDYDYSRELLDIYPRIYAQAHNRRVVLDFSRVAYLDSSALGMLVLMHKKAREQGLDLNIRGVRDEAADILHMANIQKIIPIQ